MIEFETDRYRLQFVDPVADRDRLGPRYCWGGYLYQLHDAGGTALLSGPQYPDPRPIPFHGQGMPEVFRYWDKQTERTLNIVDGRGLIIGIGEVVGLDGHDALLGEPCAWEQETAPGRFAMSTVQRAGGWGCALRREWRATGAVLSSHTHLRNTGDLPLDAHWYPHPFFPLVGGGMRFRVSPPVAVAENPGFAREADGAFRMKSTHDWHRRGHFEWMTGAYDGALHAELQHPVTGTVAMCGEFPVAYMPVWANANTISLEPHSLYRLAPGEEAAWSLAYRFGA